MTVSKDSIRAGVVLVATYKHNDYTCTTYDAGGKIRYRLPDGRDFKSISGAAGAITNIPTQNGWAFWSIASSDAPGATQSRANQFMVVDTAIKINGRSERPGGAIKNSKVVVKERKTKRTNTRKPKDWVTIEDEYMRGAAQVLAMTSKEVPVIEFDEEEYDESSFKVMCMECNKSFPNSVLASDHFNKKH